MFIRYSILVLTLVLSALGLAHFLQDSAPTAVQRSSLSTSRFGTISLSIPLEPRGVILLLTQRSALTEKLLEERLAVAAIDGDAYLAELSKVGGCKVVGGELERLGQVIKKNGKLDYRLPVLIGGVGRASSIAYHAPSQSPGRFSGRFTVDSCAEEGFDLCPGENQDLPTLIHTRNGCPRPYSGIEVEESDIPGGLAEIVGELPNVDDELPLVPVSPPKSGTTSPLVIFLSGDGGWAAIDEEISRRLEEEGLDIIGFDTLRFFWEEKTPEQAAAALGETIARYQELSEKIVLMGFSLGADVLPFMYNRLPDEFKDKVQKLILLSPGLTTDFEITLTDWLPGLAPEGSHSVVEEIRWIEAKITCLYGEAEESTSLCPLITSHKIRLPGSHHFDEEYDKVSRIIASDIKDVR